MRKMLTIALFAAAPSGCAALQAHMRYESAGFIGCPADEIVLSDVDTFGRTYQVSCRGRQMICSNSGDANHRIINCTDMQEKSDKAN